MNSLKINLPLQPQRTELEKKENFYKVMAAIVFIIGLVIIFSNFNVFSSLVFLLFTFVSYRLLQAARGEDFLKVLDNSYLTWTQESGESTHNSRSIPVITFGSGAGFYKTGVYADYRYYDGSTTTTPGRISTTHVLNRAAIEPSLMRFSRSGRIQYLTPSETAGPRTTSVTVAPCR